MAESCGVDTAALKQVVFVQAALLAGLAGWLHAHFLRFVSPHAFGVNAGIDYLFMAVIGGASHVWGALVGAADHDGGQGMAEGPVAPAVPARAATTRPSCSAC